MVKRKQVKDGDVDMEGTDPRVRAEDSDDEVYPPSHHTIPKERLLTAQINDVGH